MVQINETNEMDSKSFFYALMGRLRTLEREMVQLQKAIEQGIDVERSKKFLAQIEQEWNEIYPLYKRRVQA